MTENNLSPNFMVTDGTVVRHVDYWLCVLTNIHLQYLSQKATQEDVLLVIDICETALKFLELNNEKK